MPAPQKTRRSCGSNLPACSTTRSSFSDSWQMDDPGFVGRASCLPFRIDQAPYPFLRSQTPPKFSVTNSRGCLCGAFVAFVEPSWPLCPLCFNNGSLKRPESLRRRPLRFRRLEDALRVAVVQTADFGARSSRRNPSRPLPGRGGAAKLDPHRPTLRAGAARTVSRGTACRQR